METRAPEGSTVAAQAAELEDEFGSFLASQREDPKFAAAYEDVQERHAILDKLVKCRKQAGLTQTEVAKRMGVSQPTVSGFETEGSDPRLSTLQRYARAVQATITFKMDLPAICEWVAEAQPTYAQNPKRGGDPYRAAASAVVRPALKAGAPTAPAWFKRESFLYRLTDDYAVA